MINDISSLLDIIPEESNGFKILLSENLKIEKQYIKQHLEVLVRVLEYKCSKNVFSTGEEIGILLGIMSNLVYNCSFDKFKSSYVLFLKQYMGEGLNNLYTEKAPCNHGLASNIKILIDVLENEKWSI